MSEEQLFVIGAGLARTGTASLKIALERLYGEPCYHMFELVYEHRNHAHKWIRVDKLVAKNVNGENIDPKLFHEILKGYRCIVDFPGCAYYAELLETYPNAKVILTVRDPESWLSSIRETVMSNNWVDSPALTTIVVVGLLLGWNFIPMIQTMWKRCFGPEFDFNMDEPLKAAFLEWTEKVRRTVSADKLLIFNVKDGWKPLCDFLEKPVPTEPFPWVNERQAIAVHFRRIRLLSNAIAWGFPVIISAFFALSLWRYIS